MKNLKPRMPRHESVARATVTYRHFSLDLSASAGMADFSRQGAQLIMNRRLEPGQDLSLTIMSGGNEFVICGTVRWTRPIAGGWCMGVKFHEQASWEVLGELFLDGALIDPAESGEQDGEERG